jgi:hypothetical protein
VSKLVARLEARLGSRLLHRTTRALTLTDEGEAYYRAALPILRDLDEAEAAAAGGSVHGRLRINATVPSATSMWCPRSCRSAHCIRASRSSWRSATPWSIWWPSGSMWRSAWATCPTAA